MNKGWLALLVLLPFLPVLPGVFKACRAAGLRPHLPVLGLAAGVLAEVFRGN